MERLLLAALLLASLILQVTRSDPAPQRVLAAYDGGWSPSAPPTPPVPPVPPMPPMPPMPPHWHGFVHDFDVDVDVDLDLDLHRLRFLDHLSLAQVVSRELAAGEQDTCPSGSVCSFECEGGGCKVDCESGSVCSVTCDGGRCHNACGDGAVCSLECDGDDCTSACGDGALCHVEDGDGRERVVHRRRHPRRS
jgi:hypothetical protein